MVVNAPDGYVRGDTLLDLVASLPTDLTVEQQELAGHLLARLFCRFVSMLDRRVVSELARGALADDEASEWFAATHRLAGLVVRASALPEAARRRQTPPRTDARVGTGSGRDRSSFHESAVRSWRRGADGSPFLTAG